MNLTEDFSNIPLPNLRIEDTSMEENFTRIQQPQSSSQNTSVSQDTLLTDIEDDMRQKFGQLDVKVVRSQVLRSNSIQDSQMKAYEMKANPRGYALIIDIEVYENDIHERRYGSDVDVDNLKSLLQQLGFTVRVKKDLQMGAFYKELAEFANDKQHSQANMAVVAILSHGKDGHVYAADGVSIDMEYIYEYFNNKNCPGLQGKPKFFIVQACRGDRPDQGVEAEAASGQVDRKRRRDAFDKIQDANDHPNYSRARPTWEDMIIAYSTIPGYASLRDHYNGTWFIQSLVQVFSQHAHNTELIDLLRMTSATLSQFENEQGEKQTCNIEMRHLYKRIYFNPGLPDDAYSGLSPNVGIGSGTGAVGGGMMGPPDPPSLTRSKSTPPMARRSQQNWFPENKQENMNLPANKTGLISTENSYFNYLSQQSTSMQNMFPLKADKLGNNQSINQHVVLSQGSVKLVSKNWRENGWLRGVRKTMRGIGIRRRKKYKFN